MKTIASAELICIGTELLLGDIFNTNAAFLAREMASLGISVYHQQVVGDNPARLREALTLAMSRADLVITSGGLGPTYDDLTKETVASLFGRKMVLREDVMADIRAYFARTHRPMTPNNERQAMIPEGASVFPNRYGMAPGVCLEDADRDATVILLPGPPRELEPLFREEVRPYLQRRTERVFVSRNVHIFGMGESAVEDSLGSLMQTAQNPTVAPYCGDGEVRLRVTASAETEAEAAKACDRLIGQIRQTPVGAYLYGVDCGSLEQVLVETLAAAGRTIATAESCTGGLVAKRITDVPGASRVFLGSAVTYANSAKERLVGVSPQTLAAHGAVSEETACEMACGVRAALGADIGISTTGIAGPEGGTPEKPVGTVYVGLATGTGCRAIKLSLPSNRERAYIRTLAAAHALSAALSLVTSLS